jgi:DNA-binding response OmpR family regulator
MSEKIFLVEDTPDLLENLTQFLVLEGYEVIPCRNGLEAMTELKNHVPDLIITDLWMPEMDGFKFIDELKKSKTLSEIPIAVFSAAPLQENEKEILKTKVNGFIKKPIAMESFLESIHELLKK